MPEMTDLMVERLNTVVYASGLMPKEIVAEMGISRNTYYRHLKGYCGCSDENLAKYAEVLEVNEAWLRGDKKATMRGLVKL